MNRRIATVLAFHFLHQKRGCRVEGRSYRGVYVMIQGLDWKLFKPYILAAAVCFMAGFLGFWLLGHLLTPQPVEFISHTIVPPSEVHEEPDRRGTCANGAAKAIGHLCPQRV